jgi:Lhr-like helicase
VTADAPTIEETVSKIRSSLRDYIEATYHVGHPTVIAQRRQLLDLEGVLFRAPFLESTPRYQAGRSFGDLALDPAVASLFARLTSRDGGTSPLLFDPPYTHQAEALEWTMRDAMSLAVTTGTGSGKTEAFLLPMLAKLAEEAAHRPASFASPAVRAMVLYPMNALVNDQLGRLRLLLADPRVTVTFNGWAGRPPRFARYTSRTPYPGVRKVLKDQSRLRSIEDFYLLLIDQANDATSPWNANAKALIAKLRSRGKWPSKPDLKAWYGEKGSRWRDKNGDFIRAVMQPEDPELITRHEVLANAPDVLITNYSMLEYMLMRPLERPIFDATRSWLAQDEANKFLLIVDEAHLYRGAAGAEVALLMRRLRARLNISEDRLQVICTSASFASAEYARTFSAQLTGKSVDDFRTVEGRLALRPGAATGTDADADMLSRVALHAFHEGETDQARTAAILDFLSFRNVAKRPDATVGELLVDALIDYPPMNQLINATMQTAQPVHELGALIFPSSEPSAAAQAVTTLVTLGSAARRTADDAGLLPCRVHAFFRGLPGLWACIDPDCDQVDRAEFPGPSPIGKLYAQPRAGCRCGARTFEFYTCRHCGSAYVRAYTDNVLEPDFLWHEPGGAFETASGSIPELFPLDLLLEEPATDKVEPADLDLITGRLNPEHLGVRNRGVFIPRERGGQVVQGDDEDEEAAEADGEFKPCGVCGQLAGFGRSSVQDHQTKGDQPFQALVTRQIEVQPPGAQPYSDFAPLRGRKVLAFSDSRQVAARLAPNLQSYAMRDVIRPLILKGWRDLHDQALLAPSLNLERLYLSAMVGAHQLSVRLRPELRPTESLNALREVKAALAQGALEGDTAQLLQLLQINDHPPQSLLRAMYATITDRYYGFATLGLASLRECENTSSPLLTQLPDITGVADQDDTKLALVRLWLAQWATANRGIWFSAMVDGEWWKNKGGVKDHSGRFQLIDRWLGTPSAKKKFKDDWLPTLHMTFCESVGNRYRLLASKVALQMGGEWGYCERCRFTQRPYPGRTACISCGADRVRTLNPETDDVFQARKGYYRASAVRALADPPETPMSIIAAEHTAQLNASQEEAVFSKAEEHELLFQDVDLQLPRAGQAPRAAIDVLSCTTTMEVGIDIGSLSGVALRNMPPSRANYQQRAGRAGRRGNAVATVLAFGSADTHDDQYFRNPELMIRGKVDDPVLTMDNEEIARRHVVAFVLQQYHQDRLPLIDPEEQPQLFEVLGTVQSFMGTSSPLNRTDFEEWLGSNELRLRAEIASWLPT